MDIYDIQYFLEIEKRKSFSKAAESLSITQPGISRRINFLEEELGYVLFKRGKGQSVITLTDEGKAFLPIATQMYALYNDAVNLKESANAPTQLLRLAVTDSISTCTFPSLKRIFLSENPDVRLSVSNLHSQETYDSIESGETDVGIVSKFLPHKGLVVIPAYSERQVFICGKTASYPEKVHPSSLDIRKQMVLCNREVDEWQEYWFSPSDDYLLGVSKIPYMDPDLFENDLWAVLPLSIAHMLEKTAGGRIHSFEVGAPPPRTIYFCLRAGEYNTDPLIERFMACFKKQIEDHPDLTPLF